MTPLWLAQPVPSSSSSTHNVAPALTLPSLGPTHVMPSVGSAYAASSVDSATVMPSFAPAHAMSVPNMYIHHVSHPSQLPPFSPSSSSLFANVAKYPTIVSLKSRAKRSNNRDSSPYSQTDRDSAAAHHSRADRQLGQASQFQVAQVPATGTSPLEGRSHTISQAVANEFAVRCFLSGPVFFKHVDKSVPFFGAMTAITSSISPPRKFSFAPIISLLNS